MSELDYLAGREPQVGDKVELVSLNDEHIGYGVIVPNSEMEDAFCMEWTSGPNEDIDISEGYIMRLLDTDNLLDSRTN